MKKIYHVVTQDNTTTFLDHDMMMDHLRVFEVHHLNNAVVICESDVTDEEYNKLCLMRGATS